MTDFFILLGREFTIQPVSGQGNNCFYRSIAFHRSQIGHLPESWQQARLQLQAHVLQNREDYEPFFMNEEEDTEIDFNLEVERMAASGYMCPNFAPLAAARLYRINIVVVTQGTPGNLLWSVFPDDHLYADTIFIALHADHYHVLNPRHGGQARTKIAQQIAETQRENLQRRLAQQQQQQQQTSRTNRKRQGRSSDNNDKTKAGGKRSKVDAGSPKNPETTSQGKSIQQASPKPNVDGKAIVKKVSPRSSDCDMGQNTLDAGIKMDDRLFNVLLKKEFKVIEMFHRNHDCFLRSIAFHHRWHTQIPATWLEVCRQLQNHVLNHQQLYEGYHRNWHDFINEVKQWGEDNNMCPEFAPLAAARHYKVNVVVLTSGTAGNLLRSVFPSDHSYSKTIYVSLRHLHFNVLLPRRTAVVTPACNERYTKPVNAQPSHDNNNETKQHSKIASTDPEIGKKKHAAASKEKIKCPRCTRTFASPYSVEQHVKRDHHPDRTHHCDICGADFLDNNGLRSHIHNKHVDRQLPCTFKHEGCNEVFRNGSSLYMHVKRYHVKEHPCTICGEIFESFSKMSEHRNKHRKTEEVTCPISSCGKVCSSNNQLSRHIRNVHEAVKITCDICSAVIKGRHSFQQHLLNVHPSAPGQWECRHPNCKKTFNCKDYLHDHTINVHTFGNYDCVEPNCGKHFTSAINLRQHVTGVHGNGHFPCLVKDCDRVFNCQARLNQHTNNVHVERLHVCRYCEVGLKTPGNLRRHLEYVHTTNRPHKCNATKDCNKSFKRYDELMQHHRVVHLNVRLHVCDECGYAFQNNNGLLQHQKFVHGDEDVFLPAGKGRFPCRLCIPRCELPNNASWNYHRLVKHPKDLAPGDAKTFDAIFTSPNNKILVAGDQEVEGLVSNMVCIGEKGVIGRCATCDIDFYDKEVLRNHVINYHSTHEVKDRDFLNLRWDCQHKKDMAEWLQLMDKLYDLSHRGFPSWDLKRKVYDLLFIPETLPAEQIGEYVQDRKNRFFLYVGSMVTEGNMFVSAHHTRSSVAIVSTNMLMKLTENWNPKYKAVLVNEKILETSNGMLGNSDVIKKQEAKDIFTLALFTKMYERDDVFFQNIEWDEVKQFSFEEIIEIVEEVKTCEGVLTNLSRFKIGMAKKIKICTRRIRPNQLEFATCRRCPQKPKFSSLYQSLRHGVQAHPKKTLTTLTEQLIAMPASLNPEAIFQLCQDNLKDVKYWVYLAIGSNHPIATVEEALKLDTDGYVGQATGHKVAVHHFLEDQLSSGLIELKSRYDFVYLLFNWACETKREMARVEFALFAQGSQLFHQAMSAGRPGIRLINQHVSCFLISNYFSRDEWREISASCNHFNCTLPSFLAHVPRLEALEDLTQRLP